MPLKIGACPLCGAREVTGRFCQNCGTGLSPATAFRGSEFSARILCESCGELTVPAPYFTRATNLAKLVALAPITSVVGSVGFFFLRKDRFICRNCHALLPIHVASVSVLDAFSSSTSVYLVGGSDQSPIIFDEEMSALDAEARRLDRRRSGRRRWAFAAGLAVVLVLSGAAGKELPASLWGSGSLVLTLIATLFLVQGSRLGQVAAGIRERVHAIAIPKLAREHAGCLDVVTVGSALSISATHAERLLDALVCRDEAELQVDDDGRMTYRFRPKE